MNVVYTPDSKPHCVETPEDWEELIQNYAGDEAATWVRRLIEDFNGTNKDLKSYERDDEMRNDFYYGLLNDSVEELEGLMQHPRLSIKANKSILAAVNRIRRNITENI